MNELVKLIRKSDRALDRALSRGSDVKRLEIFKAEFGLIIKVAATYLKGQKTLLELKKDSKRSELLESLVGPVAEKADLDTVREIRKQMREKLGLLKIKIAKIKAGD
jgi:hypothetical protein